MEFGQGEGDYEPWKDEEAEVEIQPKKKKNRSGTPGWAKFNVVRSEKKRLEEKIKHGIPTRRIHGKHSFRSSTRCIYHNVKRIDDDEDLTRPEKVDASTQTNDYDYDSEPDDVVQDEDDGKSNGSFSVGHYGHYSRLIADW